jgi:DNA replication protein DnaC
VDNAAADNTSTPEPARLGELLSTTGAPWQGEPPWVEDGRALLRVEILENSGVPLRCQEDLCQGAVRPVPTVSEAAAAWCRSTGDGIQVQCPADATGTCPFAAERALAAKFHRLAALGIGKRYARATVDSIWKPEIRQTVGAYCADVRARVNAGQGLLFTGHPGTYKSHLLALVGDAALVSGLRVEYVHAARMMDVLCRVLKDTGAREQEQAWLSPDLDLLLIDDWGNHYGSEWAHNRAYCIVEALYVREAAVCVTTQLAPAALLAGEKGTVAIASRFADMTDMVITGNVDGRVTPQEAG